MKKFLEYLITLLVDHPDDVAVEERTIAENLFQYTITTQKEDTGKIIGREGKIIQAIRNVAKILAVKEGKQVRIEIA